MAAKRLSRGRLRERMFGDRDFYAQMVAVVVPIIIQNTVSNVVSLLDNVMVGRVGTLQMSAVAIVNQLLFVFNLCIFGGLAGAGIFATQYAGAHDDKGVRDCFRVKWMIALSMLACALVVLIAFPKRLIGMYLAQETAQADAAATLGFGMDYLTVMLWGLLPFGVSQVYASILREVGETRLPMFASVAAILVNLVFNYFLIFGKCGFPELGVTGAAIATVLSRYVETAIIVVYTHMKSHHFGFIRGAYRSLRVPKPLMISILRRGTPLLVNEFLWSSGMAVLLQCYSVRGLDVVAACNIATTVSNLFKVVFLSMGNAVAIMVGQALGANDIERAKNCTWRLMTLSVGSNLIMATLLALFAPAIPNIYNTEPHVRQIATQLIYVVAVMMPAYSFSHCCYFTLRSGGKTIITFLFDSVFTWCVNVPAAWLLAYKTGLGIVPLYFGVQALEMVKVVVGFVLVKKGVWIHNIVAPVAAEEESA
ncbi:MAG: MATE family efflux transporter [Christensenellales bacterium]|nr:MATE family efflux transporter [Christensenellales bacterium]